MTKRIEAIIREEALQDVKDALREIRHRWSQRS
jgi:nitrogen regulatory protein PII